MVNERNPDQDWDSNYESPYDPHGQDPFYEEKKHSGVGIASFIIALVIWIAGVILIVVSVPGFIGMLEVLEGITDPAMVEQEVLEYTEANPVLGFALLFMMALGGLTFIGFVLGIVSLFLKNRKKLFPVLGTIFNGLPIAAFFFFLLIGFAFM